jgi:hypothetical protein
VENTENFIFRPAYNGGGVGYADVNYTAYGGELISGLKVLGYDVSSAMAIFNARAAPPGTLTWTPIVRQPEPLLKV